VTDNLPVLISFVDADGVVKFCNATHEAWLGRPCSEIVGCHLHDVLGAAAYDEQRQQLGRALLGERVEFELALKLKGGLRHTRVSYVPRWSPDETITGVYALVMDMTAIKTVEQELVRLARFDALTGLPNRYQLNERLEQILFRSRQLRAAVALLFLDVDRFKLINDSLGHGVGDEVLKEVGRRIQRCVRATDVAARLAGDEFVVVLEGTRSADEARVVADKILDAMDEPFVVSAGSVPVSVSIGAAFVPDAATTPSRVLQLADSALYEAKASGRNTCRVASSA
jgi:diguanylate cyclase (GGDEF)-like protein/PAS domain S-box-containing protein